ncbi:MAG: hypothetical protein J0M08_09695 [Bacteroidetes bacterium]|nr:hypothetical protein [Bacteroidota bacterium]
MNNLSHKLATFISVVFHPLLVTTYGVVVLLFGHPQLSLFLPLHYKLKLIGVIFLFTGILPVANILLMYAFKHVQSIYLESKEDRRILYFTTIIFFAAAYYLLHSLQLSLLIEHLLLGALVALVITFILNMFWKVSAHMVGIGGVCMAMYLVSGRVNVLLLFPAFVFVAGLVGSSRLLLQAHTPAQVYVGFAIGLVSMLLVFAVSFPF